MSRSALTLKALGERIARPPRGLAQPDLGAARRGSAGGRRSPRPCPSRCCSATPSAGRRCSTAAGGRSATRSRSAGRRSGPRRCPTRGSRRERQACLWLDDLAALGNRPARALAQAWVQDWIHRFGGGGGPGWEPELAGRRAKRWAVHAALLTQGLDRGGSRPLLAGAGGAPALPRPRLAAGAPTACRGSGRWPGWSGAGVVLPHPGHAAALAEMAALAEALVDADGGTPSRAPEDLAEIADPADLDRAAARGRRPARDGAAPAGDRARRAGAAAAADGRRRRGALPRRRRRRARAGSTRRWPSCGWSPSRSRGCRWATRGSPAAGSCC